MLMPRFRVAKRLPLLLFPLALVVLPYLLDLAPVEDESFVDLNRLAKCDIFSGSWTYDDSYPAYNSCRILEPGFRCQENGRPDHGYTKWRWKPSDCDIPSFNAKLLLSRMRNKRIAFVGDSMGRTQWESLVCMLMTVVADQSSVFEINNSSITKRAPYLAFRFATHNLTVEYHRSPFLVQESRPPRHAPKRVRWSVRLDKLDPAEEKLWRAADVLVFNTAHWWNPSKTYQMGSYFYVAESLKLGMKLEAAYQTALRTWASWVDYLVNTTETQVFIRSLEPSHWDWPRKKCFIQKQPNATTGPTTPQPYNRILGKVVRGMNKKSVTLLNITALSDVRSDGHIGKWSRGHPPLDCSHWCLPGVPDTWNQLLYVALLLKNGPAS